MADTRPPTGSHPPQRPSTQRHTTASTQKPTGQVPRATASIPRPQTTSVPKPQTASVQKPQTASTQKPQTGSTQKSPTQAVPKAQTSSVPRPTTSRSVAPGTSRTQRAPTARSTKRTQQFAASARRPKKNPMVVGGVIIGIIVVGFIVFLMIPDSQARFEELKARIDVLLKDAYTLRNDNKYEAAIAKFREVQKVAEGHSGLKSRYKELDTTIREIEDEKKAAGAADQEWNALKSEADEHLRSVSELGKAGKWPPLDLHHAPECERNRDLLLKAIGMVRKYEKSGLPWVGELKEIHDKLKKIDDEIETFIQGKQFLPTKTKLVAKHELANASEARYGPAIVDLKRWLQSADSEEKPKGDQWLRELEGQAQQAFNKSKGPFEAKLSEGKAKAREFYDKVLARLKGAAVETELRTLEDKLK